MSKASCVVVGVTHSLGPSTENARKPHESRRYDGTTSWWPTAERRWPVCAISETGTQSAARYRAPPPIPRAKTLAISQTTHYQFTNMELELHSHSANSRLCGHTQYIHTLHMHIWVYILLRCSVGN